MTLSIEAVDQVARDDIRDVRGMIETHTAVCERLAIEAAGWRIDTGKKIDTIYRGGFSIGGTVILLLLSIIGYLLSHKGLG